MNESNYMKVTSVLFGALTIEALFTGVYLLIHCFNGTEDFNNNIFELIYLAFHIIIVLSFTILAFKAITNGSIFIKQLTYRYTVINIRARVISIIAATIGLGGTIYAILMLCNAAPSMSFPLGLKIDILNAGLTLLILGCIFILYPIVVKESKNKKQ